MVTASQLRAGMAIRHENQVYKVVIADYHPGQGKMGGVLHTRLKNLDTGTTWEPSFRAELKFEDVPLDKQPLEFLYTDGPECYFMDPNTYEQIVVPTYLIGDQAHLLQEGMSVSVELLDGRPVSVQFPDTLEVRIANTAPPMHGQSDSTWKAARLETGADVMVPPFIKPGDLIRLDVAQMKYMDRAKGAGKGL